MPATARRAADLKLAAAVILAVVFVIGVGCLVLPRGSSTAVPQAQRQTDGAGQHHAEAKMEVSAPVSGRSSPTERDRRATPEQGQAEPDRPKTTDIVQALSAAATTLFTGVLTWFAYQQIRISATQAKIARTQASLARGALRETAVAAAAAKDAAVATQASVDLAKENAVAQLRAYVFTGAVHGTLPDGENGRFAVSVEVRNCGATPAYDVRMWMGIWISDHPEPGEPFQSPAAGFQIANSVIPPAGTYNMTDRTSKPITDWLPWLQASTNAIYAYGRIEYMDVFGNHQWTAFRLACVGEHIFGDGVFQLCLEGNHASRYTQQQAEAQAARKSVARAT